MAKQAKTLDDLFHDTLKDIYYAEKKILTALPKMAKAAQSADLRQAFTKHERETQGQVDRLEQVFAMIEQPAKGKKCEAIDGLIDEGKEIMKEFKGTPALAPVSTGRRASRRALRDFPLWNLAGPGRWRSAWGRPPSCSRRP